MKALLRWLGLVAIAVVALQLFFVARIAAMAVVAPESTAFERSEIWAQLASKGQVRWRQQWMPYTQISDHLKRAVIASEDDSFVNHDGVDWNAIEKAWERNAQAEAQIAKAQARAPDKPVRAPKIRGGSTITQQLGIGVQAAGGLIDGADDAQITALHGIEGTGHLAHFVAAGERYAGVQITTFSTCSITSLRVLRCTRRKCINSCEAASSASIRTHTTTA